MGNCKVIRKLVSPVCLYGDDCVGSRFRIVAGGNVLYVCCDHLVRCLLTAGEAHVTAWPSDVRI